MANRKPKNRKFVRRPVIYGRKANRPKYVSKRAGSNRHPL